MSLSINRGYDIPASNLVNQCPHLAVFLVFRLFAAFLAGGFNRFRALYSQHPDMDQSKALVRAVCDLLSQMCLRLA